MKPRMNSLYNGLIEYWPLHEPSGDRFGIVLATQLADTNTVTQADGRVISAASFASASSERLGVASSAVIQTGDIDFTWAAWVWLETTTANMYILSKDNASGTGREYVVNYANVADRLQFSVFKSGPTAVTAQADTFGAPPDDTWMFVVGWHDAAADTVNIQVNDGAVDSTATGGALQAAGAAALNFGARGDATIYLNGRLCEVGFWKRVLTPLERLWLYNQGLGRTYPFDGRPGLKPRKPWQQMMGPLS